MNIWRIHTHHKSDLIKEEAGILWLEEGIIAVGFGGFDYENLAEDDILDKLIVYWPFYRIDEVENVDDLTHYNTLIKPMLRFRDEIQIGDIVIGYIGHNVVAACGKVTGEYKYEIGNQIGDPEGRFNYPQQRSVEWFEKPRFFKRHHFPQPIPGAIATPPTIIKIEYDANEFMKILEDLKTKVDVEEQMPSKIMPEKDLYQYIEDHKDSLLKALKLKEITDKQKLYRSRRGFDIKIDYLALDERGNLTVIEVKREVTQRDIGQLLTYLKVVAEEENTKNVRGIFLAQKCNEKFLAALPPGIEYYPLKIE